MKIVRLYTGTDSKSHFEEVELNFGGNQPMLTTDWGRIRRDTDSVVRALSTLGPGDYVELPF